MCICTYTHFIQLFVQYMVALFFMTLYSVHTYVHTYMYVDMYINTVTYAQSNVMYVHAFTYHDGNNLIEIISFYVPLVQILVHATSVTAVLYVTLVTMKPVLENFQKEIPSPQTVWRQLLTHCSLFSRLKTMRRLLVLLSGY